MGYFIETSILSPNAVPQRQKDLCRGCSLPPRGGHSVNLPIPVCSVGVGERANLATVSIVIIINNQVVVRMTGDPIRLRWGIRAGQDGGTGRQHALCKDTLSDESRGCHLSDMSLCRSVPKRIVRKLHAVNAPRDRHAPPMVDDATR
jgi:hypothetical protein